MYSKEILLFLVQATYTCTLTHLAYERSSQALCYPSRVSKWYFTENTSILRFCLSLSCELQKKLRTFPILKICHFVLPVAAISPSFRRHLTCKEVITYYWLLHCHELNSCLSWNKKASFYDLQANETFIQQSGRSPMMWRQINTTY